MDNTFEIKGSPSLYKIGEAIYQWSLNFRRKHKDRKVTIEEPKFVNKRTLVLEFSVDDKNYCLTINGKYDKYYYTQNSEAKEVLKPAQLNIEEIQEIITNNEKQWVLM